jgi:hypothetical protein
LLASRIIEVLVPVADQNLHCRFTKVIAAAWTSECQIVGIRESIESTPNQSAIRGKRYVRFQAGKALPLMTAVGRLPPPWMAIVGELTLSDPKGAIANDRIRASG